jgi:regulation of enolase protein 1 (concanavalin A-like superfamily)
MPELKLVGTPSPIRWINNPVAWQIEPDGSLAIEAGKETDWFADPSLEKDRDDAPAALFATADENFLLSARVTVPFASTFDAGVIQIRASGSHWGKLCFEFSPQAQPMIVSVVTRGRSDDCNSRIIDGNEVYLRAARLGQAFAFHYSEDGRTWHLVRHFTLGPVDELQVGFSSQSPTGPGCRSTFSEISYEPRLLKGIRSGK